MSLFKLGTIGAILNSKLNSKVKATAAIKPGYVYKVAEKVTVTGVKSYVTITVTGDTPADGTITFSVGDYTVYTTVDASTQSTAALVATLIYTNAVAALTGYGYAVTNPSNGVVKIVAPDYGSSTADVVVDAVSVGESGMTLTPAYTSGSVAASYPEATDDITSLVATDVYYVAIPVIDTPELGDRDDFSVAEGDYVRSYELSNLKGYAVELSSDLVTTTYASVAADGTDYLVPDTSNAFKWVKADARGDAAVAIKVLEKTTFGGTGFYGKLC